MAEEPQWFKEVMHEVTKKIKDVTTMDVITAVVDTVEPASDENTMDSLKDVKFSNISYYARTTMELDGDRYEVLPSSKPDTNNDMRDIVIEAHSKNTSNAIKNWNNMAHIAFTAIVIIAKMSGVKIDEDTMDLIKKFRISSTN